MPSPAPAAYDLRALAAEHNLRVVLPAWARTESASDREWCYSIHGKRGSIGVHGPNMLSVVATTSGARAELRRLAEAGIVRLHQDGDRELAAIFDPEHLPTVARVIQARRKRTVSEAQRARLAEIGAATRFVAPEDTA